jgi:hypothetical protein
MKKLEDNKMFKSEMDLHKSICRFFNEFLSDKGVIIESEIKGLFGIPDIVLAENENGSIKHVIAIELKLSSWKRAITQAFKYQSFAWESYVVLDEKFANRAVSNLPLFKKHNIGLATYNIYGEFKIIHKPEIRKPYSNGVFSRLCDNLSKSSGNFMECGPNPTRDMGLGRAFQNLNNYHLTEAIS